MRPRGPSRGPCWVYLFNSQWNDLHFSCWSFSNTFDTLPGDEASRFWRWSFPPVPVPLLRARRSSIVEGWEEEAPPYLSTLAMDDATTSPSGPHGDLLWECHDARSWCGTYEWECLLGHHLAHPVSFLLRWTDEGEVGSEDQQGMPQTLKAGSPPGIYSQIASQWGSRRCPSLWSPNNPDLLGPSWWLLGVLPHLPVAEQEGSRCAAAARKHLGRARSLQPLPTLCLLHVLFQAHFFSSPTWESSCCPEPTATILYKVIFPLSAENNTKVIPSYQRFQKKPNTSLARFRFNLIISLKHGLFCLFRLFSGKQKCPFFPFLLRPLSEGQ